MSLPRPCLSCRRYAEGVLCEACARRLADGHSPEQAQVLFCAAAYTLYPFSCTVARDAVFLLKRHGTRAAAALLADALCEQVRRLDLRPDCVTYVPRRALQRQTDGVDQSRLLSRAVARRLGLPCRRLLGRRLFSACQHALGMEGRKRNVQDIFFARAPVQGKQVLLIDDIITSGATASAAARVLNEAGARAVVALAPLRGGTV